MATLENYLADLLDFVTPEHLAIKLGIKIQTVYQRHYRQKQTPKLNILPPLLPIPSCNRLGTPRDVVIAWWSSANQPVLKNRAGRPTKAEQIAKLGADHVGQ